MPPRKRSHTEIYVATRAFTCELDGLPLFVNKGERVRAGHPLLAAQSESFEPADGTVQYDVEQATAAPGEKRA